MQWRAPGTKQHCHMKNDFTFKTVNWWKMPWWNGCVWSQNYPGEKSFKLVEKWYSTHRIHKSIVMTVNCWPIYILHSFMRLSRCRLILHSNGFFFGNFMNGHRACHPHRPTEQTNFMYNHKPNGSTWIMVSYHVC